MPRLAENPPIQAFSLLAKRWLLATGTVFAVYNPSGRSYYHWMTSPTGQSSLKLLAGVVLLTMLVAISRMAYSALGLRGSLAVFALLIASVLFRLGLGWLEFRQIDVTTYTLLLWFSTLLGVGMSWAFFERRIAGDKYALKEPP